MAQEVKICFFVPFYPEIRGGAEYQAKILAQSLKARGYDVFYISYDNKLIDGANENEGFRVYNLNVSPTSLEKLTLYLSFFKGIKKILEHEKPDIVYQRVLNTFSYRLSKYCFQKKIPMVLHIADNYSVSFDGLKGEIKKAIFKRIVQYQVHLIAQTELQLHKIQEITDKKVECIPNMHPLLSTKVGIKEMNKIVWIGNARPVKQLELFLDLGGAFSNSKYEFHIYGRIPDSKYGNILHKKIDGLKNVFYHGHQDNKTINEILGKSALLVNTSVSEGFSNTFIQSWLSGTPVLSLNADPNNILALEGLGVYCNGALDVMKSEMVKILSSPNYQDLCKKCLNYSQENFGLEKNVYKFETIIKNSL